MIRFCKICIMPDTRPRIVFNSNGICNACENANLKNKINWSKRYDEFKTLISNIKENNKNESVSLKKFEGNKVVLIVNVASFWGLTPQNYEELQFLYKKYNEAVISKIELNWCN